MFKILISLVLIFLVIKEFLNYKHFKTIDAQLKKNNEENEKFFKKYKAEIDTIKSIYKEYKEEKDNEEKKLGNIRDMIEYSPYE